MQPLFYVYSGSAITRAEDRLGNVFRAFEGRKLDTNVWGFWITKNGVPLTTTPLTSHSGTINDQGWWIAHIDNGRWIEGRIPGWNT